MSEGKYDPVAFSEGMGIFKEHLRQPERKTKPQIVPPGPPKPTKKAPPGTK